jgi:hypothetical protein
LAKNPVPAIVSSNPPKVLQTPAPYTHALNAEAKNSGVMAADILSLAIRSSGGSAAIVVFFFRMLKTFRKPRTQLNLLKQLIRSH